ncbi:MULTISPECIES: hypothetical protein [unclassified Pseudomonas]|uniref:hypothetical protein n=1 Tax=unclassified Pseudomonas TaxID=196821 RepID=UPI0015B073D7|nr:MULTISPECIES: hypothetical protein [unclassified Pseudomonas]
MKLRFSWEEAFGDLFPHCSSDVVNEDGTSLLSCILTDDGGCQLIHSLKWIDVGLARIKSVKESKVEFDHWDREDWAADFSKEMEPYDHSQTMSHGHQGNPGKAYRAQVQSKIEVGDMRGAMAMEIRDVRRVATQVGQPRKYNEAMQEMLAYAKCRKFLDK